METRVIVRFYVSGLSCGGGGATTLERILSRTVGVAEVTVNPATQIAHVRFDPLSCTATALIVTASEAGFSLVPLNSVRA